MSLNIKDPRAHELAQALAAQTGESMTHVVIEALQEKLERQKVRKKKASAEEILAIGRSFASKMKGPPIDHAEFLYDERGLPK